MKKDCGCHKASNWIKKVDIVEYHRDGRGGVILHYKENGVVEQKLLASYQLNILAARVGKTVREILREEEVN